MLPPRVYKAGALTLLAEIAPLSDMSQRGSGYQRQRSDLYETPAWVTEALLPHLPPLQRVWEPAAGLGRMVEVLRYKYAVVASDLSDYGDPTQSQRDFLLERKAPPGCQAILTNPPYTLATQFIEHALKLMQPAGLVAMLLRCDFDHAQTRRHLFSGCSALAKKIVLTKRIVWFARPGAAPSFNHAWFVWDWRHNEPPTLAYGPATARTCGPRQRSRIIAAAQCPSERPAP
jgi:hypothetical protein